MEKENNLQNNTKKSKAVDFSQVKKTSHNSLEDVDISSPQEIQEQGQLQSNVNTQPFVQPVQQMVQAPTQSYPAQQIQQSFAQMQQPMNNSFNPMGYNMGQGQGQPNNINVQPTQPIQNTNGVFTIHKTEREAIEKKKAKQKKHRTIAFGIIGFMCLSSAVVLLLIHMQIIKLPQKIDKIYANYSYNCMANISKFDYDKKSDLVFVDEGTSDMIVSSENKNSIVITSDGNLSEIEKSYDGISNRNETNEENNGVSNHEISFSGTKDGQECIVYLKEVSQNGKKIVVVLNIVDNTNEQEVNTLKQIFKTAVSI